MNNFQLRGDIHVELEVHNVETAKMAANINKNFAELGV